jgi:Ser/Thr protein kinase RdoA (MazF antagonist)
MAVVFEHAPGVEWVQKAEREQYARRYGAAVARLHNACEGFESEHTRFELDLGHLMDEPLAALRPLLAKRPDDDRFLGDSGEFLRERVAALVAVGLEQHVCHGDLHGGNANNESDGRLTFFDFDSCGAGHRAYELAVFRWTTALDWAPVWETFLEAYREHRPFSESDLAATAPYVAIRHIWWTGVRILNADDLGSRRYLDDRFFDEQLGFLARWCSTHLDGAPTWASRYPRG